MASGIEKSFIRKMTAKGTQNCSPRSFQFLVGSSPAQVDKVSGLLNGLLSSLRPEKPVNEKLETP
jgi:hypothetical protein